MFATEHGLAPAHFAAVLRGEERVTIELAVLLARTFDTSTQVWLGLQIAWDVWHEQRRSSTLCSTKPRT